MVCFSTFEILTISRHSAIDESSCCLFCLFSNHRLLHISHRGTNISNVTGSSSFIVPSPPLPHRSPEVHREANTPTPPLPAGSSSKSGVHGISRPILPLRP